METLYGWERSRTPLLSSNDNCTYFDSSVCTTQSSGKLWSSSCSTFFQRKMNCLKFILHPFATYHPDSICVQVWFDTKESVYCSFNLEIVLQIPEEEKDPVYKYFESMMTCARVREFNAKPPPQVSILPEIFNTPTSTVKEKKTVDDSPKTYFRTLNNHIKEGKKPKTVS